MSTRESFLRRRQTGIGGSDVGAIVGVNRHRNALDVYLDKIGEVEDLPSKGVLERGRRMEPIVREMYFERTGRRRREARFRRHAHHKWMIGHPDALVRALPEPANVFDELGVLECKTMNYAVLKKCEEKGLPEEYQLQGQHYGVLCNVGWVAFALLHPDSFRFAIIKQEIMPEITKQMLEICEHFWFNHVVTRIPPKPKDAEWAIELPAVEGIVEDRHDKVWVAAMDKEFTRRAMLAEAKALHEEVREEIRELCTREGVFEGGGARVYLKQREGAMRLQEKVVRAAGLIDPFKLAGWALDADKEIPGVLALLQVDSASLKADIQELKTRNKGYQDLRIFHISEAS